MKVSTKLVILLMIVSICSLSGCTKQELTTTTTRIEYTQYEVLSKQIFYDSGLFGRGSIYRMDVRVNGNEIERWKLTNNKELYYRYEVGDFFYKIRWVIGGIVDKKSDYIDGKAPIN
jgi:hypothetical protein